MQAETSLTRILNKRHVDFTVSRMGGLTRLLTPQTNAARQWVIANLEDSGYQPLWPNVVLVEARLIEVIILQIQNKGLNVR